jgi:hypothetical protein
MLVEVFNVVKVESVPLNSMFFWRAARRSPAQAVIGDREHMPINTRRGLLAAGGAVAAVTATVVAALTVVMTRAPTATDEDEVRAVLNGMNGSYNRSDFEAFASHVCADMLRGSGYEAGWHQSRESDGPTQITVNSVDVKGDDAVASVRFVAANHDDAKTLDIDFLREGAEWKACRYHPTRSL